MWNSQLVRMREVWRIVIVNNHYETVDGTGSSYYLRPGAALQRNLHKTFSLGIYLFVALLF